MIMKTIETGEDIQSGLLALQKLDPDLKPIIKHAGKVLLRREAPGFAGLSRIIIGQHVSTASASAIHRRFVDLINPVTPQNFLAQTQETLIAIGLTRAKQTAIANCAQAITDGTLNLDTISELKAEEAIAKLTELKGIGPWTAEIYLLFCTGHPDIFAAGDVAIREAYRHANNLENRPDEKHLRQIATKWSPYRGIATRLFWSYYESVKGSGKGQPV
jgi:DNA-3-methyladenine glycosylase II